jgi:hypothetical protein
MRLPQIAIEHHVLLRFFEASKNTQRQLSLRQALRRIQLPHAYLRALPLGRLLGEQIGPRPTLLVGALGMSVAWLRLDRQRWSISRRGGRYPGMSERQSASCDRREL